ncbi:hypothetical protein BDU57DRAFT_265645 [Ampelomyces quisqualis]|uniref:DUF7905 domain-containing protein n=1 Tax=Ampelomyces quisqualis TaxID=50730 RepID=A0A6A5QL70_AMPQU|nr:hypothetical protein BDU57DRAFT_265645 [Ampelomyces quisqualis]
MTSLSMDQHKPTVWNSPPATTTRLDPKDFIGKKPSKVIPVPLEFRRRTHTTERDTLVHELEVEARCFLRPHSEQGRITSFEIFSAPGAGSNVEGAVARINHWISTAHAKSSDSSAWAKTRAWHYNQWYYNEVAEIGEVSRKQYTGSKPSPGDPEAPKYECIVEWPKEFSSADGQSFTPRDIFGNKLEALNKLRMQDRVWITLKPADGSWHVEIAGDDIHQVDEAKEHFMILIAKMHADNFGVQHAYNLILDRLEGLTVELQEGGDLGPNNTNRVVVPRLLPHPMMNDPGDFRQQNLHATQLSGLYHAIRTALENVRHRAGTFDFVVRLGSLALSGVAQDKIGKTYPKESFQKDIEGTVKLSVKKWLADDVSGYRILRRLMTKTKILEPTRSATYFGHMPSSLETTQPTFHGTWVFRDPNSADGVPHAAPTRHAGRPVPLNQLPVNSATARAPEKIIYVVQIDWTDDEEGEYEKGAPRYYRLETGEKGLQEHMDVNLLELGESRGWQFALESMVPVPLKTVPPILTNFADRLKMRPNYSPSFTESFAEWDATSTVKRCLQTGRLDSIYRFGLKGTCYKVELIAMWYPQKKLPIWGLSVRHSEWETHLAELESLSVGRKAGWDEDTMSMFFPQGGQSFADAKEALNTEELCLDDRKVPTGDGLAVLVNKLMAVSEVISSVTNEGGVRI